MNEAQYLAILHADFEAKFRAALDLPAWAEFHFEHNDDGIHATIDGQLWTFDPGDDDRNTYWWSGDQSLTIVLDDATVEAGYKFADEV